MTRRHIIAITGAAALFAGSILVGQTVRTQEVQLRAAQNKEQVEGDLKGAIEEYKKLTQSQDRNIAAKALVRMAVCYEKLGRSEARATYERIVREYSDQTESASTARIRLTALGGPPSTSLTARFVMADSTLDIGSVSQDGRYFAMADWSNDREGDLVVKDTSTGLSNRLETGSLCAGSTQICSWSEEAILSKDNRQVAYRWWDDQSGTYSLRIIQNKAGAKPRILEEHSQVEPGDWSPDGKSILGVRRNFPSGGEIVWVSANDGSLRVVKSIQTGSRCEHEPKLSPDGKFIVYAVGAANRVALPITSDRGDVNLYVLAADGSGETQLTTTGINERPLWTQDGSHILFVSNRSDNFALWSVAVREGKKESSPALVKRDTGRIRPVAVTRSGSYFFVQDNTIGAVTGTNIFEAEVDPASGKQISAAKYLSESFVGWNNAPAWSPDGKFVAFKRRRTGNIDIRDLVVRSIESGEETTYTAPDWTNSRYGFGPGAPKWLHDGSGFFVGDEPIPGQQRWLGRMDLKGQFAKLIEIAPKLGWTSTLSPDDKIAYVYSRKDNSPNSVYVGIVAVDVASGEQRIVFPGIPNGTVNSAVVSNDGRTLAFFVFSNTGGRSETTLATVGTDGNQFRTLYVTAKPVATTPDQIQWAKDGQAVFFIEDGRWMRLPLPKGEPEFTGVLLSRPARGHPISLRGDGSRIVFSDGAPYATAPRELWVLDNLRSVF